MDKTNINFKAEIDRLIKQVTPAEKDNYKRWLQARTDILKGMTDDEREKIELTIKLFVLKIFKKRKDDFFHWSDFLNHPLIKKYFKFLNASGDRNIGKTTSAKKEVRKVVDRDKLFIWLRNIQDEIKALVTSGGEKAYFANNRWRYQNQTRPDISDFNGVTVGYYRDINTIGKFKSIDFPDVELIVWDEYNSRVTVSDKFSKFVEFVTTVERYNPHLKIILQSNFITQNDEILENLGVGIGEIKTNEFVKFNWITGAMMIFIPSGVYKSVGDEQDHLGYRLSLTNFDVFQSQYGGKFRDFKTENIIKTSDLSAIMPMYNIYYNMSAYENGLHMTMYLAHDKNGKQLNYFTTTKGHNDMPIFVFDHFNLLRYNKSFLLKPEMLEKLIVAWRANQIKTDSSQTYDATIKLFGTANKILENANFELDEINEF